MSKIGYYDIKEKERQTIIKSMFKTIAELKNPKEVEKFFYEMLSLDEIIMVGRRMQIAKMLLEGYTREEIVEKLRVGAGTVNKIDKWLNQGIEGYRSIAKKAKNKKGYVDYDEDFPLSFSALRHKFPAHFWLINLLIKK